MKTTTTRTIDCPPEALWPWLDETEKCKQWLRGLEDVQPVTPGPKRAGHVSKLFLREGRRVAEYEQTILDYEPKKRFRIRMMGGCFGANGVVVDYRLEDLGGRTRLDYECDMDFRGAFVLLAPLVAVLGRVQLGKILDRLQALAEGRGLATA